MEKQIGFLQCTSAKDTIKIPLDTFYKQMYVYISGVTDYENAKPCFMQVPYSFVERDGKDELHIARPIGPFYWCVTDERNKEEELNNAELPKPKDLYYLYDTLTGLIHLISNIKHVALYWSYKKHFKNLKSDKYYSPMEYAVDKNKFGQISEVFNKTWYTNKTAYNKNLGIITSWGVPCGIYEYVRQLLDVANFKYTILAPTSLCTTKKYSNLFPCFDRDNLSGLKRTIIENKIDSLWIQYSYTWFRDDLFPDFIRWCQNNNIRYTVFAHSEMKNMFSEIVPFYVSGKADAPECIPIAPPEYKVEGKTVVNKYSIGTFGFAHAHKKFENVYKFITENPKYHYHIYTSIGQGPGVKEAGEQYIYTLHRLACEQHIDERVHIYVGYLPEKDLIKRLSTNVLNCLCYDNIPTENQSAAVALLRATGRPIATTSSKKLVAFSDSYANDVNEAIKNIVNALPLYERKAVVAKSSYTKKHELYKNMKHIKPYGDLRIAWRGDLEGVKSFSIVNRKLIKRFVSFGAEVALTADNVNFNILEESELIQNCCRTKVTKDMISTGIHFPPLLSYCTCPIGAWETSKVPDSWVYSIGDGFKRLITISEFCKQAFINGGMKDEQIAVIPMGIDNFEYGYKQNNIIEVSNLSDRELSRPFTFLNVSWPEPRKGTDVLIDAFTSEFTTKDDVILAVKTFKKNDWLHALVKHFKEKRPRSADIIIVEHEMESMEDIYKSTDVFVHPLRGEGFGMPVLEAAGYGVPSIVTGYAGPVDFTDDTNSWHIKYRLEDAEYHHRVEGAKWASPSVGHLKKLMRYTYNHPEIVKQKGEAAYLNSLQYSWDDVSFKLASIFYEVSHEA